MSTQPQETLAALSNRMNVLERQNRIMKMAALAAAITLTCGAIMGAAGGAGGQPNNVLEAEKIVFRDSKGKIRGTIEASAKDGIVQMMYDDQGNMRIRF